MILPNFLILGAQKCGTTWMYEVLREHPQVFLPEQRELEFFSYTNKISRIGLNGYSEYFAGVTDEKAIGEKTASYLWNSSEHRAWCNKPRGFQPDIPRSVLRCLGPDVNCVVSLRDPVSRAISAYVHHIHWKNIERGDPFLEAGQRHGIVHMGFYYEHLKLWFDVFDPARIKVFIFEDMMRDQASACVDLFTFLDVDPTFRSASSGRVVHKGIDKVGVNGAVYTPKPGVQLSDKSTPRLDQLDLVATRSDLDFLRGLYFDDVCQLEDLLQRDLSSWPTAARIPVPALR